MTGLHKDPVTDGVTSSSEELNPRELIATFLRFRWLVIGLTIASLGATALWTFRQPKIYTTSCTIEYNPNPPRPLGDEVQDVADSLHSYWMTKEFFHTQNKVIGSRVVAENAAATLGLHHNAEFMGISKEERKHWQGSTVQRAALILQQKISIAQPDEEAHLVYITATDTNPEMAARLANAVAEAYIQKTKDDRVETTVDALNWLGNQLDDLKHQLDESETTIQEFKKSNGILAVSLQDRQQLISSSTNQYNNALAEARTSRIQLNARLQQFKKFDLERPFSIHASFFKDSASIEHLRKQYHSTQAEKEALSTRYSSNHPLIKDVEARLQSITMEMRAEIQSILQGLEAELKQAQSTEAGIQEAMSEKSQEGLHLNEHEAQYQRLVRDRENKLRLYNHLLERSTETNLTRLLKVTHARIVDLALVPYRPTSPSVRNNLVQGTLFGFVLALCLAFVLSRFDRRINTIQDAQSLGLTIMGILPAVEHLNEFSNVKLLRAKSGKDLAALAELTMFNQPMSSFSECARTVRTNLTFMSPDQPLRSMVITSADQSEGKTLVSLTMAISFAQNGHRVLVVDTDFRKPRIHRIFGAENTEGATTVLSHQKDVEDVVLSTPIENLFVLPSGPIPPNPAELLHSKRFKALKEQLSTSYDYVIFDSPPLGAVADAAIIGNLTDGAVVVTRAHETTKDALEATLSQLSDAHCASIVGIINGVDLKQRWYRYTKTDYRYYREQYQQKDNDRISLTA
ncbi:MAG: polysaccharide biosynthesis tyrosine autokinase [Myxococcales bacterium]|nr:MAG: polysaccharide biosynthesis tyrosine autokinase [Myxococcales bacterium]